MSSLILRAAALATALAVAECALGAQAPAAPEALRVARIFGDGMVVQRDARVPVWGWAPPSTAVSATLAGRAERATADASGRWRVVFPAMPAGRPLELSIAAAGTRIVVHDILVGDVWVASGQSNMEWPVSSARNAAAEIASANDPEIRAFDVPHSYSESPEPDVSRGRWAPADSQHVGAFTAVGYFFARDLRKSVKVPIGLIHTSWGGSNIETWMSRDALGMSDSAWLGIVRQGREQLAQMREALRAKIGALPSADSGLVNGRAVWADPALDDRGWATMPTPGLWESAGYDGMDGIAWYRTSFSLTDEDLQQPVRLSLGPIDDSDITWVNGVEVGRTEQAYARPRLYPVPASALRTGTNVVAVRVDDTGGGGGIYGNPALLHVEVNGTRRSLAGAWRFKVGEVAMRPDAQRINKVPTVLYNAMLHPLLPFSIKGVIWYQGESNANSVEQAAEYRRLFPALIASWRREWRGAGRDFPFLWVQLPNYGPVDSVPPSASGWATLRESQTAALALPNTGQAIAIDLGGPNDLHPLNKQDVGARLALKARAVAYRQRLVSSGPTYRRHVIRDGRVVIEFGSLGSGLVSRAAGERVTGFAIAGADRHFVWADARIEGDRVVVWSDRVPNPTAVRYLWTNSPNPPVLYNREGLPAAPFRTDAW